MKAFPIYLQHDQMDCGPTCLRMVAKHYGKNYSLEKLRDLCHITKEGVSLLGISEAAEAVGFKTMGVKTTFLQLFNDAPKPFIAHWRQEHFVVVYDIKKNKNPFASKDDYTIYIADPAAGKIKLSYEDFMKSWASGMHQGEKVGISLLLETTPEFTLAEDEKVNRKGFGFLFDYLFKYKPLLFQLGLGFLLSSIFQFLFPFLCCLI